MKLPEGWGTLAHIYLPAWFLAGILIAWIGSAVLSTIRALILWMAERARRRGY